MDGLCCVLPPSAPALVLLWFKHLLAHAAAGGIDLCSAAAAGVHGLFRDCGSTALRGRRIRLWITAEDSEGRHTLRASLGDGVLELSPPAARAVTGSCSLCGREKESGPR